jgi:hypothetical protein
MSNRLVKAFFLGGIGGLIAGGILFLVALVTILPAHAATTKRSNSLGVVTYDSNPMVYVAGNVVDVSSIESALNLRFQPLATYALYDQNILLCRTDLITTKFQGKHNPLVLTYERQAHRTVNGVGCHELVRVDNLESGKGELQ